MPCLVARAGTLSKEVDNKPRWLVYVASSGMERSGARARARAYARRLASKDGSNPAPYSDIRPSPEVQLHSRQQCLEEITSQANYETQDCFVSVDPELYCMVQ